MTRLCLSVHFFLTSTFHVQLVPLSQVFIHGFLHRSRRDAATPTRSLRHWTPRPETEAGAERAPRSATSLGERLRAHARLFRTTARAALNLSNSSVVRGKMRWCWCYESTLCLTAKKKIRVCSRR